MLRNFLTILVMGFVGFTSCSKSNDNDDFSQILTQANWTVHYSKHNGVVNTTNYSGYTFTFATDKSVTATKSGAATVGIWSQINDSGKDKLIINWVSGNLSNELMELEEDWLIVSSSVVLLQLSHGSGSGAGDDELHFHR